VGRHLYEALTFSGLDVVCGSRNPAWARRRHPDRTWVEIDAEKSDSVRRAVDGCSSLVYLVHRIGTGSDYVSRELSAARNVRGVALEAGLKRVVYLGGVAPDGPPSPHLGSRLETGRILRQSTVPTVELRAGMIIGAGSASWHMVADLAERLPAMLLPRWLKHRSSPVFIDDVVVALRAALRDDLLAPGWYDVPGPEVLTHEKMLQKVAEWLGKSPSMLPVPVVTPALSSYWIALVTRTHLHLAREIVQGLQADLVPRRPVWAELGDHQPTALKDAIRFALRDDATEPAPSLERIRRIQELLGAQPQFKGPSSFDPHPPAC
jgi:uncharacterized protein YbjT (DUF2867 family)